MDDDRKSPYGCNDDAIWVRINLDGGGEKQAVVVLHKVREKETERVKERKIQAKR